MTAPANRPVLMSREIAVRLGVIERWVVADPTGYEGGLGVASVSEVELLGAGAARVDWNDPDELGRYTPTLYAWTATEQ